MVLATLARLLGALVDEHRSQYQPHQDYDTEENENRTGGYPAWFEEERTQCPGNKTTIKRTLRS